MRKKTVGRRSTPRKLLISVDQLREVLVTALEKCWDGEIPFREVEEALSIHGRRT